MCHGSSTDREKCTTHFDAILWHYTTAKLPLYKARCQGSCPDCFAPFHEKLYGLKNSHSQKKNQSLFAWIYCFAYFCPFSIALQICTIQVVFTFFATTATTRIFNFICKETAFLLSSVAFLGISHDSMNRENPSWRRWQPQMSTGWVSNWRPFKGFGSLPSSKMATVHTVKNVQELATFGEKKCQISSYMLSGVKYLYDFDVGHAFLLQRQARSIQKLPNQSGNHVVKTWHLNSFGIATLKTLVFTSL